VQAIESFTNMGNVVDDNRGRTSIVDKKKWVYGVPAFVQRSMLVDISNMSDDLSYNFVKLFGKITDCYLLRRLLDKDYITNAIIYTGAAHSLHYIQFLVKYFDFKITHAAYSTITNIEELNSELKTRVDKNDEIISLLIPPRLFQCSDLTDFPKEFK